MSIIFWWIRPVRTATRIYGPWKLDELPPTLAVDAFMHTPLGDYVPGIESADMVLSKILTARSLIAVGLLGLAVEVTLVFQWRWAWLGEWALHTWQKGLCMMLIAPFVVFGVVALLVILARPEVRGMTLRAGKRPIGIAAFTLLLMVGVVWFGSTLFASGALDPARTPTANILTLVVLPLVLAFTSFWLMPFFVSAVYLAQRNGLNHDRSLPLMSPLMAICVAWLYLGVSLWFHLDPSHLTGLRLVVSRYGPPTTVTALAIWEIVRLRRVHGVGFRGPLYGAPF